MSNPAAIACFQGTAGVGALVTGRALVASDGFSARYDLDRINGVFSRPTHKLGWAKLCRTGAGARHRQGRGRYRLDAARDGQNGEGTTGVNSQ